MKKLTAFILSLAMALALSACGASETDNSETAASAEVQSAAEQETEEPEEAETEAEETEAETEPEPAFAANIESSKLLENGSWLFQAKNADNKDTYYLYNISEGKLTAVNENINTSSIDSVSGNAVIAKSNDVKGVYNAETGEAYYTFDDNNKDVVCTLGYNGNKILFYGDKFAFENNRLIIVEKEESFSGNTYSLGIMNDDGEWISPMSSDRVISESDFWGSESYMPSYSIGGEYIYFYCNANTIYDVVNDKLITFDKIIGYDENYMTAIYASGSDCLCFYSKRGGIYKGDISNITVNQIVNFDSFNVSDYSTYNNFTVVSDYNYSSYIINLETGELVDYDLSGYDSVNIKYVNEDAIAFECDNGSGTYTAVTNFNGELAFDPIKGTTNSNYFTGSDSKIICTDGDLNFVYNTKTKILTMGNTDKNSDDYLKFVGYDSETDTLLVQAKNPEDGNTYYYLADANDPTNYYSPFEK